MLEVQLQVLALPHQVLEAESAKLLQQRQRRVALMATSMILMRLLQQRSGTPRSKLLSKMRKMVTVLKLKLDLSILETLETLILETKRNDRVVRYSYIRTGKAFWMHGLNSRRE
jgi:hypothetical protein